MGVEPVHGERPFLARRLAESDELRQRVEAARALGISLRRFEGWEPTTRYEHDDAGRLVASTPEPEWDDVEQGWMLALARYERERCGRCGGDLYETTDPRNEDRYRVLPPVQCHRCDALGRSEEAYADHPHAHALMHLVELRR